MNEMIISDELDRAKSGMSRLSRRDTLMLGSMASLAAVVGGLSPCYAGAAAPSVSARICEILFTIYPGGTLLDFAGPHEVFS